MLESKPAKSLDNVKPFKKSLLALSVMAFSVSSFAQDVNSNNDVEEVVVYGMKTSLENAQDIKRNADTVKDVITSSDIGALPDKSVTEALQRVPGVTIERFASSTDPNHFAAEGRGVVVRGLDKVRSEFNGRDTFSANTSGGLNFEDVSPELLGSVEVIKNQTADMIAGGISGTVNLITLKPFDNEDLVTAFTARGSYGDLAEEFDPSISGLFSNRFETAIGEFGFLISAAKKEFTAHGDGLNVQNFYERSATQTEMAIPFGRTAAFQADSYIDGREFDQDGTYYAPMGASIRSADSERDRSGITAAVQWQNLDETIVATAEFIRSDSEETWSEYTAGPGFQGFNAPLQTVTLADMNPDTPEVETDAVFDSNGRFVSGSLSFEEPLLATSRSHHVENTIEDFSFNLKLSPTDRLRIELDAQTLDATSKVRNNSISNGFNGRDMHLDLSGSTPSITYLQDTAALDSENPQLYYQASILDTHVDADGELQSYAADVEFDVESGWVRSVSGGIYFSEREQRIEDDDYANWGSVSAAWAGDGLQSALVDHPELYEEFTFGGDFFDGSGLAGANRTFLFPRMENTFDIPAYDAWLEENGISNTGRVNRSERDITGDGVADTNELGYLPFESSVTKEARTEAYFRIDLESDTAIPVTANLGVRYVKYDVESEGSNRFVQIIQPSDTQFYDYYAEGYPELDAFFDGTGTIAESYDAEPFDTFLPSANINIGLTDELNIRVAASKALFFPELRSLRNNGTYRGSFTQVWQYDDLPQNTWDCDWSESPARCNAPVGISDVGYAGFRNNPDLEPEKALQFDITTEWYFAEVGSLTLALFHKKITDIIRESNFVETVVNPNTSDSLEMIVRKPVNEGEGTIQGFEIAYQQFYDMLPGAFSGLGLQVNYTYIDQEDLNDNRGDIGSPNGLSPYGDNRNTFRNFTNLGLPGLSEDTFNMALMYEYGDISARMAYNWRSDYLLARRDADSYSAIWAEDYGTIDASFWYTFTDYLKVGIEGVNLTADPVKTKTQFNQEGDLTPKSQFITDRRYAISLRAKF
ncbi:Vitamin B12 transporter BtuB [Thalassocella blandensis]|nr:Vitamin B12 transporter BtuB [Thalassocella blandensis]